MPKKKGKEMPLLAASNGSDAGVHFTIPDATSLWKAGTTAREWC
jgi:hypothetical protein